ncbi:MAG: hypothetical protein ABJE47_07820 [bacterium]
MSPDRVRASIVITLIVLCSAVAGAGLERYVWVRMARHRPPGGGRMSPEQDARHRNDMLDRMTKSLDLSTAQRAGIESVMVRTDSSLRLIRHEMQPRIKGVFDSSRAEISARLDKDQRAKFEKDTLRGPGVRGGSRP